MKIWLDLGAVASIRFSLFKTTEKKKKSCSMSTLIAVWTGCLICCPLRGLSRKDTLVVFLCTPVNNSPACSR